MKELIKIRENNGQQLVNARELHQFLNSKQEFANWIRNRIEKYSFEEGKDFLIILSKSQGGRPSIDYGLTLDMAKELGMVENNEKGRQARRYFIAMEKKAKAKALDFTNPDNVLVLVQNWKKAEEEKKRLALELKESAPKVQYYQEVLQSESTYNTNQIAKELGMSAITLNKKLKALGIQYKQGGTWLLRCKYQSKGFTRTKTHTYSGKDGEIKTSMSTVWTEKGREFIHARIKGQDNLKNEAA